MIVGTGIDIVEIDRMEGAIKKWGTHFLSKVFTAKEIAYSNAKPFSPQHFAARFAAKEAVIKAFGEPRKFPVKWTDLEVMNDKEGKPVIRFHNNAVTVKKKKKVDDVLISMSHSKNYAVAHAILLKKGR
jgi:holo-[acyl-carrier protein] synthase